MGRQSISPADEISAEEFSAYLAKYEECIEAISVSKACKSTCTGTDCRGQNAKGAQLAKPGDKTLAELDRYRYGDAVAEFSGVKPRKQMGLDDVKTLVSWKL